MMFQAATLSSFLLLVSIPAGGVGWASADTATALPSKVKTTVCPKQTPADGWKYHCDSTCDRATFNGYKQKLSRNLRYEALKKGGTIAHIPNQKTVACPLEPQDMTEGSSSSSSSGIAGLDTIWIVENTASTPIVISYLNSETGMEVSAKNPHIVPAQADPEAILQPEQWMPVYTFEGHVFLARSFDPKTGLAGPVLMQHRAGLIPVGEYTDDLECPDVDIEPLSNNTEFVRTPSSPLRPCNTLDVGFRNVANCPLHGYYVTTQVEDETCTEQFKFHLGVEKMDLNDYMYDWVSQTKYEGSFIGHSFHFRLANNPNVLVDTVTLQTVKVTDCPGTKVGIPIGVSGETIAQQIHRNLGLYQNSTTSNENTNSTAQIPFRSATPLHRNILSTVQAMQSF